MNSKLQSWTDSINYGVLTKARDRVMLSINSKMAKEKDYYKYGSMEKDRCHRAMDDLYTGAWLKKVLMKQSKHKATFTACTCQDHRIRKVRCRHILGWVILEEYLKIIRGKD
jgi:hypothetical protein